MRMRKGAPLLVALVALLGMTQAASASNCGVGRFSIFRNANCDAQSCYSSCQQQNRVCYKLVYDTVEEKRWHTTYKTVCETVNKQVTRTCYTDEVQTLYRQCKVTKYKDVIQECCKPVTRTCWKEVQHTVCKPCIETCVKDVECTICRRVPRVCEKDCCYTVCKPVYEQHCHVHCCQVQKTICEQRVKECCQTVCRRVCETHFKDVCCQISKCVEETCMKQVCVPACKDVQETCYKTVTRRVCEPVTTYKTVTKRISEYVDAPCDPGKGFGPFRGGIFRNHGNAGNACADPVGGVAACGPNGCGPTGCADACFDPCACKTFHLFDRLRAGKGAHGSRLGGDPCNACNNNCDACNPTTRKVWRVRCVTEQVPCTTNVTRCITEKVPYTVCKKVRYNEIRQVPYTVRRQIRGAYVDDKGVAYDCDAPGRSFKEGAVIRKQVPYTTSRMVTSVEKKLIPYTVSRVARGAYVDGQGNGHTSDGPGRSFKEGAHAKVTHTTTTRKMVQERHVKKVQYTVWENVVEKQIKKVPYQVCRMVPTVVTKKVPHTVCEMEKYTVCKKVAYTECVSQPYTVTCKKAHTITETVPCVVRKTVKVCVPQTVCVKKARMVPVSVSDDPGAGPNACGPNGCGPTGCTDPCTKPGFGHRWFGGRTNCNDKACGNDCGNGCQTGHCFLNKTRQRCFASLHTTGCCEETCKSGGILHRNNGAACSTTCNDGCNSYCREGLMQRLFRNRFCCETSGCDNGCVNGACGPTSPAPAVPVDGAIPKALPKN